ncbi:MAG: hypothetical protein AAFU65_10415 [Pseudomonadota bacterium]
MRQNLLAGIGTHLVSSAIIYVAIAVGISYLTIVPTIAGFALSAILVSVGEFVPNEKDPETRIRMRMHELKSRKSRAEARPDRDA